jgi:xanthine dehydrogenase YagR molybdenum-binding subunit
MSTPSVLRYEAALKVTGTAVYEGEVPAASLLHAALVQAPISCGEVLSIDAMRATGLPGFAAIICHSDSEVLEASPATALIRERTIHFAGSARGAGRGRQPAGGARSCAAIELSLVPRQAVAQLAQASDMAFAPAMVGRFPAETHRGDATRALADTDLVVRHRYDTSVNIHHPMEPHVVVCWWEGSKPVVHTSTQAIFGTRAMIAHAFRMPASDIRVVSRFLGGGFGCKGQLWWPWMFWAMLASRKAGRPVRLELTRAQMFTLIGRRQETVQDLGLDFLGRPLCSHRASCIGADLDSRRLFRLYRGLVTLPLRLPQRHDHAPARPHQRATARAHARAGDGTGYVCAGICAR